MIAAYAIVLLSVLGGVVVAQQAALAHGSAAVICYGNGGSDETGDSKASLRHIPCAICSAVTMAPPSEAASLPLPVGGIGEALGDANDAAPHLARLFSPRLSQAPPVSA